MGYRTLKIIEENFNFMSIKPSMGYWDICAGDAICRELGGGSFVTETGLPLDYNKDLTKKVGTDFLLGNNGQYLRNFIEDNRELIKF